MRAHKSIGLSFRVTPKTKLLLEAAAAREHRSLTNMLELLVEDYCARHHLGGAEPARDVGEDRAEFRTPKM